jgi:hypothetical protein
VYTKEIAFLLRLLGTSKQSGVLLVEAPGPDPSPWLGQFQLENGQVLSCMLLDKADGRVVLRNEEALRWLMAQGKMTWRLEDGPHPPALSPPAREETPYEEAPHVERFREERRAPLPWTRQPEPAPLGPVPHRTEKGKLVPAHVFASREHRQVFALVDGHRTIDEIAHLLQRPSDAILRVLQELQAAGFIV